MRSTLATILFLVTTAAAAAAQQPSMPALSPGPVVPAFPRLGQEAGSFASASLGGGPSLLETAVATRVPAAPAMRVRAGSGRAIIHAVGGAVIGAWIGYFASQLAVSDWDRSSVDRAAWAAGGAVVGSLSGFAVSSALGGPGTAPGRLVPSGRNIITTAEIRQSGKADVYSIVSSLRPEWVVTRGTHSMRETPQGGSVGRRVVITDEGTPSIVVYLDRVRLGGIGELRQISAAEVTLVEYLTPSEATLRFGGGHTHGAIVVHMN